MKSARSEKLLKLFAINLAALSRRLSGLALIILADKGLHITS